PYESNDPDTRRIWWTDVGVHQNLTFGVHPDPISGMHCWHQAVRVRRAEPGEAAGDIGVHIEKSRAIYRRWLEMTRSAFRFSPDDTRRPYWLLRPLKPSHGAYQLREEARRSAGRSSGLWHPPATRRRSPWLPPSSCRFRHRPTRLSCSASSSTLTRPSTSAPMGCWAVTRGIASEVFGGRQVPPRQPSPTIWQPCLVFTPLWPRRMTTAPDISAMPCSGSTC